MRLRQVDAKNATSLNHRSKEGMYQVMLCYKHTALEFQKWSTVKQNTDMICFYLSTAAHGINFSSYPFFNQRFLN